LESLVDSTLGFVRIERANASHGDIVIGFADHVSKRSQSALTFLQRIDRRAKNLIFRLKQSARELSLDTLLKI
jgi:hypothetical protein